MGFQFNKKLITKTTQICKAMSEPIRLKILGELGVHKKGKCECIGTISRSVEKDQSVVYRHIKILEKAGLVKTHKERNSLYSCTTPEASLIIKFFRKDLKTDLKKRKK